MVLGFDASTSTVGWAFSENKNIIDAGFIDIKSKSTYKDKSFLVIDHVEKNINFSKVDKIYIEAALSAFASGFTSQQVIISLSRFNAVFEYILSERWKINIELLNVNTARKKVIGKCREKGMKSKDFVKTYLEKIHPIHNFDVLNARGNWDKRNSDMYDAMILSLF
jgi:RNase H-fold protein (predicted Holliday junction resolvase)